MIPENTDKIELTLCMGSSCFARGNKKLHIKIRQYIETLPMKDRIEFKGHHCLGHCSKGPNIKINATTYEGINESNIIETLNQAFSKLSY